MANIYVYIGEDLRDFQPSIDPNQPSVVWRFPENGLSPRQQAELGDLALAASRDQNLHIVTVSENLLLRLRLRIAETTRDFAEGVTRNVGNLNPDELTLHFVRDGDTYPIAIGEYGDIYPSRPEFDGYFSAGMHEIIARSKTRREGTIGREAATELRNQVRKNLGLTPLGKER